MKPYREHILILLHPPGYTFQSVGKSGERFRGEAVEQRIVSLYYGYAVEMTTRIILRSLLYSKIGRELPHFGIKRTPGN